MTRVSILWLAGAVGLTVLSAEMIARPAQAKECWQGWGYMVDPRTMAYKSGQSLYVTEGAVDWSERKWGRLYRIDPSTGRRIASDAAMYVQPRKPVEKGSQNWANIVEDVVEVKESEWGMLLRLTHIAPSPNSRTLNDNFTRWACGLG